MAVDLMRLLPEYFRPVLEFKQIMEAHGKALEKAEQEIRQLGRNCFIQTADAATLKTYESLFGLLYKPGETLEYRRQRILQLYNYIAPFSIGFLRSRLTDMFGDAYTLEVDPVESRLKVHVTSSQYGAVDLLYSLVWDIVPAHMEVTTNHQITNDISGKLYAGGILSGSLIQTI